MNKAVISGIIKSDPKLVIDHGEYQMRIKVKIQREDIGKDEELTLFCRNEEMMHRLIEDDLHAGDLFTTSNGYIETVNYIQDEDWACSHCGHVEHNSHKAEIMNVCFHDYQFLRSADNDGSAVGINRVFVSGIVNTKPVAMVSRLHDGREIHRTKFKLEIRDENTGRRSMYPFVIAFRQNAETIAMKLNKGDRILLYGSAQERNFLKMMKNMKCPDCGYVSSPGVYYTVREVIMTDCEILARRQDEQGRAAAKESGE